MSGKIFGSDTRWRGLFLFTLAAAPFYLNDFVFIATETPLQWLAADYAFKFLVLLIVFALPFHRDCVSNSFAPLRNPYDPLPMTVIRIGVPIFLCFLLMIAVEYFVGFPLWEAFPDTALFRKPTIENPFLYWFDLTFGLALTAISEEFVFRSIAKSVIGKFTNRTSLILMISALIFTLIHWSHGVPSVGANFFNGIVLMALYLHTRSIAPPIIVHYLINVWHFA